MGWLAEEIAFRERMTANWATTPIFYENSAEEPDNQIAYVAMQLINTSAFQVDFGKSTNRYRHTGLVLCQIFAPRGIGAGLTKGYADTIATIWRSARFSGITCGTPRIDVIPKNAAERYQVNVVTEFYRDEDF